MLMVSQTLQPLHPGFMTGNLNENKDYTQCYWDRFFYKFGFPMYHSTNTPYPCITEAIQSYEVTAFLQNTQHAVAQLVQAMRYKQAGFGFDSRYCHQKPSLGTGVDSAPNSNKVKVKVTPTTGRDGPEGSG
jgi:hypothetical protein